MEQFIVLMTEKIIFQLDPNICFDDFRLQVPRKPVLDAFETIKSYYLYKHVRYYLCYYCRRAVKLNFFYVSIQSSNTIIAYSTNYTP